MTDPGVDLGEIVVVGQRRRPGGSFPSAGGGGGSGETGGPQQNEVELEDPNPPPQPQPHPCDNPDDRKIWDADARAAAGVGDLQRRAASLNDGSSLVNREFGANFFLDANGYVDMTTVSIGPTPYSGQIPEVTIEPGGTTYLNWMGDIHNHPSGNGRPSGSEWIRFVSRIDAIRGRHPGRGEISNVSMYITVLDPQTGQYKTYAYKKGDDPNVLGEEINPQGQPCPNA